MSEARLSLALLLVLATPSLAQTTALSRSRARLGITLPPNSVAWADEATAGLINPAGLAHVGRAQLLYAHDRDIGRGTVGDGLFLGATFFDLLGAAISWEWVRHPTLTDFGQVTYALAFGGRYLSIGGSYHNAYSIERLRTFELDDFDLAISSRPLRFLSFGLVARNLSNDNVLAPREYQVGVGLRPFKERVTLGIDYLTHQQGRGLTPGELIYSARVQALRGLSVLAGVGHGFRARDPLLFQVGLTVDTSNLGLTYAAGQGGAGTHHVVLARVSPPYPALPTPGTRVAVLDLDNLLSGRSSPALSLLGMSEDDPYLTLTRALDAAIRDPELGGLVIKVSLVGGGLGKAEELRQAILKLRGAGKKVFAVLLTAADAEYLVASAADRIYAVPESVLLVDGFSATPTFLGGSMNKLGVHWDVARVGAYKGAPDQLTRMELAPEQRETIEALLDTDVRAFEAAVTQARGLSAEALRAAIDEGLKTPKRAVELKLVDEVLTPQQIEEKIREELPGARFVQGYSVPTARLGRWGIKPKVAVVPVIGNIAGGKSRTDPVGLAEIAGAETVVSAIRSAAEDPEVAAIVVRVDSGGGDGLASDLMYRAVLEAKKKKPVVASMGDVAASGGYYAAMGAHEIIAQPTTVTGSIGVFMLKPAVKALGEKLGARQEQISRGALAGLTGYWLPWTDAERQAAQKWVDAFYDDFITEVGQARGLPKEQVHQVAQGRVWSGADAKERGLVDRFGGLLDAIEIARQRAGVSPRDEVEIVLVGDPKGLLASAASESSVVEKVLPRVEPPLLPAELRTLAKELGVNQSLVMSPRPLAMMEYALQVR